MKTCKQPDRHEPKLVCGYPIPCPYHTIVIEEDDLFGPEPDDKHDESAYVPDDPNYRED